MIEQARRQLEDLVPVWAVLDYTQTPTIERELLLAKLSILGPEYAQDQLSGSPTSSDSTSFDRAVENQDTSNVPGFVAADGTISEDKMKKETALARSFESAGQSSDLYPSRQSHSGMSASEALIAKNLHLSAIKTLADQFGGRGVDVAESSCIVELTAKSSRVDAFLSLMRPFGVLEAARSGRSFISRPVSHPSFSSSFSSSLPLEMINGRSKTDTQASWSSPELLSLDTEQKKKKRVRRKKSIFPCFHQDKRVCRVD